jgi:8-oxo-dGTP pyrophosphatase MutT (NUDIX family)
METEYVPVIDEDDEVLYNARRSVCHSEENPLWHRSVTVLTFRSDDMEEILVQRRSDEKERKPGLLEFAGGHVLAGEDYCEAAIREYSEELLDRPPEDTGIEYEDFLSLGKVDKRSPDNCEKVAVYATVYNGSFDLSDEVADAWFEPFEDVVQDIGSRPERYTNSTRRSLEEFLEG